MAGDSARFSRLAPEQRRESILQAATVLFSRLPYDEVSTTDIAEQAGIARGLLNHYFGTKRQLYLEVVQRASTVPQTAVVALPDADFATRIDAAVTWFLDALEASGRTWIRAMGSHGLGRDAELEAVLTDAENASVLRVIEAVGLSRNTRNSEQLHALIRTYGALARAAGREYLFRETLTRQQTHALLVTTLTAVVGDAYPAVVALGRRRTASTEAT